MSLILTCPECATRYVAKAESLEPPGRTVRCSRCEHTWFQDVAAPAASEGYESLFEEFEAEAPAPAPETAPEAAPEAAHVAAPVLGEPDDFDARQRGDTSWDDPLHEPDGHDPGGYDSDRREHMRSRDEFDDFDAGPEPALDINPAGKKRRRFSRKPKDDYPRFDGASEVGIAGRGPSERSGGARLVSGLISLFGTIAVVGAVGAGAWYFKPQIIELVPQTEALYALLPVEALPSGYDLRNTGYIEANEEGRHVLIVSGEVVNRTDKPLSVPVVQVTVSTIDGKKLDQWSFKPRGEPIGAGQSRYFETRRLNPPEGAQKLRIIVLEEN